MNPYSNLLVLPECDLNSTLVYKLKSQLIEENHESSAKSNNVNVDTTAVINSIISCIRHPAPLSEMQKIDSIESLLQFVNGERTSNYCQLKFYVIDYYPRKPEEIIMLYSEESKESFHLKDNFFKESRNNLIYYYNVQLKVCLEAYSNSFFTVYLSTYDGEGTGFMGCEPGNCYLENDLYTRVLNSFNLLINRSSMIEATLQLVDGKAFRIVGDYNNLNNS